MSDPGESVPELTPGQRIRIVAGIFENFEAIIESVDDQTGIIKAGINVFGRVTLVEVNRADVRTIEP
jgi:transcription antitermination factor NusG